MHSVAADIDTGKRILTLCVDADVVISRPFHGDVPPAVRERGKPLLHLTEIQSAPLSFQIQKCQTKVFV